MKAGSVVITVLALLTVGCGRHDAQPQVYQHFMDQLRARYPILGWPCRNREARDCYRFDAPRKMHGLWSAGWEESQFIDSADPVPKSADEFASNKTWLEVLSSRLPHGIESGDYEIEFIGRKTAVPGHYGQMGESKNLVIVDRLISIRPVSPEKWIAGWVEASKATQTPR